MKSVDRQRLLRRDSHVGLVITRRRPYHWLAIAWVILLTREVRFLSLCVGRKRRTKVGIKPPKPTKQIAKILDRYRDGGQILKVKSISAEVTQLRIDIATFYHHTRLVPSCFEIETGAVVFVDVVNQRL